LSNLENTKESPLSQKKAGDEIKKTPMLEGQSAEEVKEPSKAPEPTATGDEKITILKHSFHGIEMTCFYCRSEN